MSSFGTCSSDFWTQFVSNLLATVFGTLIIYFLVEQRLKDFETRKTTKGLIVNLYQEVIKDYVVAERIAALSPIMLTSSQFPVAKFDTTASSSFIALRPVTGEEKFYLKLRAVVTNMESTNRLIDMIFTGRSPTILANKKAAHSSATKIKTDLDNILSKIASLNKGNKYFNQEEA